VTTYQEHKNKATSEKIVLAWLEPSQRLFAWTVHSGSVYKRTVPYYVVGVRQDATALTSVSSLGSVTGAGKFFFDPATRILYVWSAGSVDPGTLWTDVTYRLFFSNAPIDLPADMANAVEVPYDARIQKTSKFKAKFDQDQKGIALEGTGKIELHNNDGFFAGIYDKLVWENKAVKIFSYARNLAPSERLVLFNGVVTNKDFDDSSVSFDIKDFIYKLRTKLDLPIYDTEDGDIAQSILGKPKRRIYGRVNGLLCDSLEQRGPSYALQTIDAGTDARTGTPITVTLTATSNAATASSTDVHKELCAGDTIVVNGNKLKVKSLARLDIGLDTPTDITLTTFGTAVGRLAFTGIVTTSVSVGDHITLSVLSNSGTTTKARFLGHFPITTVNATYLEFTLATTYASASETFKSGVGEVAVTRHTNTVNFTLQQVSPITVAAVAATVEPATPYRRFNRRFLVAHHALSTKATTITGPISAVKFSIADADGIYEGDIIRVNGTDLTTITGLDRQGLIVTIADTILPLPDLGQDVERLGIQTVTFKQKEFTQFEDFTPSLDSEGATITFDYLAEFNAAVEENLTSRVSWVNTSKQVLGSNAVFRDLKPRDWIKSSTESTWYEIAEKFSDNLVILNTPYTGTTGINDTSFKRPTYIEDTSKIIADVYGKTVDATEAGTLIATPVDVVKDLLDDAGLADLIDEASFDQAAIDAPYLVSLALPQTKSGSLPTIRDAINLMNDSCTGSLFNDLDGNIRYKVLDASRTLDDTTVLDDGDLIKYSISTDSSKILRKTLVRFAARDADTVTEEPTYSVAQAESIFTENSGIEGEVETSETGLYLRTDAEILAQRLLFIRELSSSTVSLSVKLQLADAILNDLITVNLARMYLRLGTSGSDATKTGLISSMEKDGLGVRITIDDLGNLFNRVAVITDNDAPEFTDATEAERRYAGYITDAYGVVDDEDGTFNANVIG
jgi:hypothetical protein